MAIKNEISICYPMLLRIMSIFLKMFKETNLHGESYSRLLFDGFLIYCGFVHPSVSHRFGNLRCWRI